MIVVENVQATNTTQFQQVSVTGFETFFNFLDALPRVVEIFVEGSKLGGGMVVEISLVGSMLERLFVGGMVVDNLLVGSSLG